VALRHFPRGMRLQRPMSAKEYPLSNRIDVSEVIRRVCDGAQLVDVLPASIFRQEHLPGAVNVPLETLERAAAYAALDESQPIVVYCFDQH
jgi:rhodanese-related sulfurtransferase